jgi:hypothetical protein
MNKIKNYILLLSLVNTFCKSGEIKMDNTPLSKRQPDTVMESERFESFYERFHSDSVFQISRVSFPLFGFTNDKECLAVRFLEKDTIVNGELANLVWLKEQWQLHKPFADSATFTRKIVWVDSSDVLESIFIPDSDFLIKRKFRRDFGKWHLVFYYETGL